MKKNIKLFTIFIIMLSSNIYSQEDTYFVGANANYLIPLDSFSERFENSIGTSIYFVKKISPDFSWVGKFEYIKFSKLNSDNLTKKVSTEINDVGMFYDIPLEKLDMEFESFGLSAEAKLNLFRTTLGEISLGLGFGFYKWDNYRSEYIDTVKVTPEGSDSPIVISEFNVPKNEQSDWSGALNIGIDADINVLGPIKLNIGGYYKVIIGELWPALSLDIENVSGIQMFNISCGIKYNL